MLTGCMPQAGVPCGKQCKCESCLNKTPTMRPPASAKQSLAAKRFASVGGGTWRNPPQQPPQLVIPPLPGTPTAQWVPHRTSSLCNALLPSNVAACTPICA